MGRLCMKKRPNDIKKEHNKTGGGEPSDKQLSELEERIIAIIGTTLIYGLPHTIDTALQTGVYNNNPPAQITHDSSVTLSISDNESNPPQQSQDSAEVTETILPPTKRQ